MNTYLVQGCSVSLICERGASLLLWVSYIIERGGVPMVSLFFEDGKLKALQSNPSSGIPE